MIGSIPFSVPAKFAAGIADGSLLRFGTIIKEAGSGQIVAHVQESGLTQGLINSAIGSPFSPVSAASSLGANVQLAGLTRLVEGLQILQFANLGVSLVGIGVSAVGFKVMNTRLDKLQTKITEFAMDVELHFLGLEAREFRTHESRVKTLMEQGDQAYSFSRPEKEWVRISHAMAEEAGFYRGEVEHLLGLPKIDCPAFETLTQLYTSCNTARVKCLLLADELRAAREVSQATASQYNSMFDPLNPVLLAKKFVQANNKADKLLDQLERGELIKSQQIISSLRDAQDAAATRPMLVDTLITQNISGRGYIERLESEKEEPLLCLEVK